MNGIVTCGHKFYNYIPRYFTPNFARHIIAPFWADADGRHSTWPCSLTQESSVFYNIYEDDVSKNGVQSASDPDKLVLDSQTQLIITRAQQDALSRDSEFKVSWVIVITWSNMIPYPYYYNTGAVSHHLVFYIKIWNLVWFIGLY